MKIARLGVFASIILGIVIVLSIGSHVSVSLSPTMAERRLVQAQLRTEFAPEEIKEDLIFFGDLLDRVHPPPIPAFPLNGIDQELNDLLVSVDRPLTRLAFYRQFAPVVHGLNDEHVMVHPPESALKSHLDNGGELFPLEVQYIKDRLFVAKASSDQPEISAGSEILSVNGVSAEELLDSLVGYFSGTSDAQRRFYVQRGFAEALFYVYGFSGSFALELHISPSDTIGRHVVSGQNRSLSETRAYGYDVIAPQALLFTYDAFENESGDFAGFLREMFRSAKERQIRHLIIDIRGNQGGAAAFGDDLLDFLTEDPFIQLTRSDVTISKEAKAEFLSYVPGFMRWFPVQYLHPVLRPLWTGRQGETASLTFDPLVPGDNPLRYSGEVHLLVGPGTMSSASLFAATMQAIDRAVLYGEPTGGYPTHYGNIIDSHLPNTGLRVWMPTSVNYGHGTGPIVPDHIVLQTAVDLTDGKDTVLEYVLEIVRHGS